MAEQYDNTNRGSVWKNEKADKETSPHFTGSLNVEGVEYWVSAWKRKPDAKETAPALSFSIKKKEAKQDSHNESKSNGYAPKGKAMDDDFKDDIPF